mmetsp:Transcript_14138/g.19853  ORF Transcript_14138/g.19853 Transcript_14138/m.19853 type:complete len:257 (-) Transcript_14138:8-778(-)
MVIDVGVGHDRHGRGSFVAYHHRRRLSRGCSSAFFLSASLCPHPPLHRYHHDAGGDDRDLSHRVDGFYCCRGLCPPPSPRLRLLCRGFSCGPSSWISFSSSSSSCHRLRSVRRQYPCRRCRLLLLFPLLCPHHVGLPPRILSCSWHHHHQLLQHYHHHCHYHRSSAHHHHRLLQLLPPPPSSPSSPRSSLFVSPSSSSSSCHCPPRRLSCVLTLKGSSSRRRHHHHHHYPDPSLLFYRFFFCVVRRRRRRRQLAMR